MFCSESSLPMPDPPSNEGKLDARRAFGSAGSKISSLAPEFPFKF